MKSAILKSRYRAATMANKEMLSLYYGIGKYISENSRKGYWGKNAIETISERLQVEMPGLRGFSAVNIKRMRLFYEEWEILIPNRQLVTGEIEICTQDVGNKDVIINRPLPTDDLDTQLYQELESRALSTHEIDLHIHDEIRQSSAAELTLEQVRAFLSTGFTHHCEILAKTKTIEERLFYIEHCATEFWSVETLRYL